MNVIVAGASRGIGFEVVRHIAGSGKHRIIAISRDEVKLKELEQLCSRSHPGSSVTPLALDLAAAGFGEILVRQVRKQMEQVDLLIYNAGYLVNKPFDRMDAGDFDRSFDINVKGAFLMVRALLPYFSAGSHVLAISSMGGYQGSAKFPGLSLYSASKGALAILTECLAEELGAQRVKCNCLALGAVQTEMLEEAFPGYRAPLSPQEMGAFIADFGMNGHRFFNGKILPVSVSTP